MPIAQIQTPSVQAARAADPPAPYAITNGWTIVAYAIIAAAALAAWGIFEAVDPGPFIPQPGISLFAVLYVVAQALERLMEPIAPLVARTKQDGNGKAITKRAAQQQRLEAIAAAYEAQDDAERSSELERSAKAQAAIGRARRNTALWIWVIATVIALLFCGALGLRLLHAIGLTGAPVLVDLLVTGLAIGGGTKPLHDLISNIQKAKEQKEDPQETGAAS